MRGISALIGCVAASVAIAQLSIPLPCYNQSTTGACNLAIEIVPESSYCRYEIIASPPCTLVSAGSGGVEGYSTYHATCTYRMYYTITIGQFECTESILRSQNVACASADVPFAPCGS